MVDITIDKKKMCSVTPKYNYVMCLIENSNEMDKLSFDVL